MFDENENIFPAKPELISGGVGRNRFRFLLVASVAAFVVLNYFSDAYLLFLELLLVLFIHELGHYVMVRFYGVKAQGIFIMSLLGNARRDLRFSRSQRQQVFINLMGPLPGIVIGISCLLIAARIGPNVPLVEIALLFLGVNLLNLMPIDPFDGGRIVESLFFNQNDQNKMMYTLISSLAIIGAGVFFNFLPLVIFGFLMGIKVRGYQKSKALHDQLNEGNINYKKEYSELTNKEYWKIRGTLLTNNPRLKEIIPSGYTLWENESLLMEQVRLLLRIDVKSDLSVPLKVGILLILCLLVALPIWVVSQNYDLIDWYINNAGF